MLICWQDLYAQLTWILAIACEISSTVRYGMFLSDTSFLDPSLPKTYVVGLIQLI